LETEWEWGWMEICMRKIYKWDRQHNKLKLRWATYYSILTDLINALPDNSINTVQNATVDEDVFSMSFMPHPVLVTVQLTRNLTCDTCFLHGLCHATIEGWCFLSTVNAERILENVGMRTDFTWVLKLQGNSSVARIKIRPNVWCYMCCSTMILGVCNLVRLL
jgi:hypothetical protein